MNLSNFTIKAPGAKTTQNTIAKSTVVNQPIARRNDFVTLAVTAMVTPTQCTVASAYPDQLSLNPSNPVIPRRIDSRNTSLTSPHAIFKR